MSSIILYLYYNLIKDKNVKYKYVLVWSIRPDLLSLFSSFGRTFGTFTIIQWELLFKPELNRSRFSSIWRDRICFLIALSQWKRIFIGSYITDWLQRESNEQIINEFWHCWSIYGQFLQRARTHSFTSIWIQLYCYGKITSSVTIKLILGHRVSRRCFLSWFLSKIP